MEKLNKIIENLPPTHDVYIQTEIDGVLTVIFTNSDQVKEITNQLKKDSREKLLYLKYSTYKCIIQTRNKYRDDDIVLHYLAVCLLEKKPIQLYKAR